MKVLHVTNNYPTKSSPIFGVFVKEQIDSLKEASVSSEVFFINGREKGKLEYANSIFKLLSVLKNTDFDLVHCHHVFSSIIFILTGYYKKIPSVVSFQNDPEEESTLNLFNLVKNKITIWIFKNNSILVDNSRGFYFPNGVNTQFFQPIPKSVACSKLGIDPTKIYILFVSSNFIRKQKRYDLFVKTIEELKKWKINIEPLEMINVKRELVPYYFNASSLHLLTSDFEGSPNSVKESMSCNIPVVANDVGNVRDMLKGDGKFYITKNNSIDEFVLGCKKVLSDNGVGELRDIIIRQKYDIVSRAHKLLSIYEIAQGSFKKR